MSLFTHPHAKDCAILRYGGGPCDCGLDTSHEEIEALVPSDARLRGDQCECPRCGKGETFPTPMPIAAMTPWLEYFKIKHRWCKKP